MAIRHIRIDCSEGEHGPLQASTPDNISDVKIDASTKYKIERILKIRSSTTEWFIDWKSKVAEWSMVTAKGHHRQRSYQLAPRSHDVILRKVTSRPEDDITIGDGLSLLKVWIMASSLKAPSSTSRSNL
uniref:PLAT domain-containing protein n=1 Tax=Ascaris lumbricoides TaxID=6252 RepID=A0A0M3HPM5_ASCLU